MMIQESPFLLPVELHCISTSHFSHPQAAFKNTQAFRYYFELEDVLQYGRGTQHCSVCMAHFQRGSTLMEGFGEMYCKPKKSWLSCDLGWKLHKKF